MKFKKKLVCFLGFLCFSLTAIILQANDTKAYDVIKGTSYQYYYHSNIPSVGTSFNRTKASEKTDASTNSLRLGTFLNQDSSAWLGNYGRFANYNRYSLSELVQVKEDVKCYATESTSVKNGTDCFSQVTPHNLEVNNTNWVKLNFSANKK